MEIYILLMNNAVVGVYSTFAGAEKAEEKYKEILYTPWYP